MSRIPITRNGYDRLKEELRKLKAVDRIEISKEIQRAREFGDLSENAEYHTAKEQQGLIEARINKIESQLGQCNIIEIQQSYQVAVFGATVSFIDLETEEEREYQLVSELESDIKQKKIAIQSPIAKAMIGKKVGDIFQIETPKAIKEYEILKIQ